MLTKTVLDAQTTVELPAREMLTLDFLSYNGWVIIAAQTNANFQVGLVNVNGQVNSIDVGG